MQQQTVSCFDVSKICANSLGNFFIAYFKINKNFFAVVGDRKFENF